MISGKRSTFLRGDILVKWTKKTKRVRGTTHTKQHAMLPTGQTQHRFTQGFCSRSQTQEENQRWNTDSETGEKTDEGNTANWQTTMVESPKPRWRKNGNHSGGRDINFNGGKWETAGSKGMVVGEGKKRGSITPQLDPKWHSIEKDHPYKTRKGQKPKKKSSTVWGFVERGRLLIC